MIVNHNGIEFELTPSEPITEYIVHMDYLYVDSEEKKVYCTRCSCDECKEARKAKVTPEWYVEFTKAIPAHYIQIEPKD